MRKIALLLGLCLWMGGATVGAQPLPTQDTLSDTAARCAGLFSVSPTTQIRFSPGNLQYQPATGLWRFAPEQTEVVGWKESYALPRYRGWIDLFGWGTGAAPTNYSEDAKDYPIVGLTGPVEPRYMEWGHFCALPTENGKHWRAMTLDEWTYLLSKRPRARRLYALAYVCGRYGLMLLPDNWQCPKGVYVKTGPREDAAWAYGPEKWALLEAAGAVFLPAETKRIGTTAQGSAYLCRYWTSTPNSKKSDEAVYLLVDNFVPQTRSIALTTGLSVRLVQEVDSEQ